MRTKNKLSKRQLNVIADIFSAALDEPADLDKHNVNARLYCVFENGTVDRCCVSEMKCYYGKDR